MDYEFTFPCWLIVAPLAAGDDPPLRFSFAEPCGTTAWATTVVDGQRCLLVFTQSDYAGRYMRQNGRTRGPGNDAIQSMGSKVLLAEVLAYLKQQTGVEVPLLVDPSPTFKGFVIPFDQV